MKEDVIVIFRTACGCMRSMVAPRSLMTRTPVYKVPLPPGNLRPFADSYTAPTSPDLNIREFRFSRFIDDGGDYMEYVEIIT